MRDPGGILPYKVSTGYGQSPEPLPTAGVDGRMIYKVKPGDSCISISVRFGVDYKTLLANNNLTVEDCATLTVGKEILLGVVQSATNTPLPTELPPGPTPTPTVTTGRICVILFEDINGDTLFESNESPSLAARSASAIVRYSISYRGVPQRAGCVRGLDHRFEGIRKAITTSAWLSRKGSRHHEHELPACSAGRG